MIKRIISLILLQIILITICTACLPPYSGNTETVITTVTSESQTTDFSIDLNNPFFNYVDIGEDVQLCYYYERIGGGKCDVIIMSSDNVIKTYVSKEPDFKEMQYIMFDSSMVGVKYPYIAIPLII